MERIAYKIALDVTKAESQKFLTGFSVGETRARVLKITLNNGRNPIHFDGTETVSMFVTKPSDTSPSIGLCYLEEDTIIYNVLQSDVSEEGPTKFTIKVQHLDEDQNISVLYAAHFTVQVTDPECDDSHVPDDPNYSILEALIAEVEQFNSDAEAFAIGTRGGVPVGPGDPAYENNAKFYAENLEVEVEEQVERAEAWATGTKGGVPVPETDPQHNNNAKYYAEQAEDSADNAVASALNAEASETNASNSATAAATSEANALSYKNAASGSASNANASALAAAASEANALSYKNAASGSATNASNSAAAAATSESNALNHKNAASQSATDASGSAASASGSANAASGSANTASQKASDSEAWAEGTRGGVPVGPGDPAYEHNAKFWAEESSKEQIQADWEQTDNTKKDFIKHKPTIPSTAADISLVTTGTSLPGIVDDLQKLAEYMFPPGVTVTLTLNGAKEDQITIKDSNNQTVATCNFASGQTSGSVQLTVPVGGASFKFVSSKAKGITSETLSSDYEKTVALSDAVSQTVNVYPKLAQYWFGNFIDATVFSIITSPTINRNDGGYITENTNSLSINTDNSAGVLSNRKYPSGIVVKALCSMGNELNAETFTESFPSDAVNTGSVNLSRSQKGVAFTDQIVSGTNSAEGFLGYRIYFGTGSVKSVWLDDGHENDITIHGAKEDTITITDSQNQTVATCIFGSDKTYGYVSKALLPSGTYKFTSSVAKDTTGTNDYEKTIVLDGSETEVEIYPDGVVYWYGNFVNGSPFWDADNNDINKNASPSNGSITLNTNNIVCAGPQRWRGIISSTPMTGSTIKALITAADFLGDGMVAAFSNANDTTANTWTQITTIRAAQTNYILSGPFDSNKYAIVAQYNATLTIKAVWTE